ncbi:MAG: hypothetical protein H6636_13700 [Anaerolineales bacterium]|nr:hypothetical protein [Anaerolineales bacterium]
MNALFPSFYALFEQVVDYAGLFPPASLPLEVAIRNFIRYQAWPEQWMLARFIVPVAKLGELGALMEAGLSWEGTLKFSVLGGGNVEGFRAGVVEEIKAVEAFRARWGTRVQVEAFEARCPEGKTLFAVEPWLREAGLRPFFEVPFGPGWEARVEGVIRALAEVNGDAGFKLRTGGVTAEAFPSVEQVAWALCQCQEARVPIKCTAGLHHPVRCFREEVGTKMHGFLNVWMAGILAWTRGLDQAEVAQILAEEDPAEFVFSVREAGWRGRRATKSEVESARQAFMVSFGSCSFEEPKEDLEALGYGLGKSGLIKP